MVELGTQSFDEFKQEFRKKIYAAIAAGVIVVITAIAAATWALVKNLPGKIGLIPSGTVAAFDLVTCPTGWSPYNRSWGRFIIGAVSTEQLGEIPGAFRQDGAGSNLVERPFGTAGGVQSHTLTIDEMPAHDHGGTTGDANAGPFIEYPAQRGAAGRLHGDVPFSTSGHSHSIPRQGGNQPHENMPPYVALHYCKKD